MQFMDYRSKPGDDGGQQFAGGFRTEFPEPVDGLIALGYGCHFGRGLFVSVGGLEGWREFYGNESI